MPTKAPLISSDLSTRAASRRSIRAALTIASLTGATLLLSPGCARPLLAPDEDRSPFDRYDALRNQQAPQTVEDAFGRRNPNLRGRLAPKSE
jgi:hypothetical protein